MKNDPTAPELPPIYEILSPELVCQQQTRPAGILWANPDEYDWEPLPDIWEFPLSEDDQQAMLDFGFIFAVLIAQLPPASAEEEICPDCHKTRSWSGCGNWSFHRPPQPSHSGGEAVPATGGEEPRESPPHANVMPWASADFDDSNPEPAATQAREVEPASPLPWQVAFENGKVNIMAGPARLVATFWQFQNAEQDARFVVERCNDRRHRPTPNAQGTGSGETWTKANIEEMGMEDIATSHNEAIVRLQRSLADARRERDEAKNAAREAIAWRELYTAELALDDMDVFHAQHGIAIQRVRNAALGLEAEGNPVPRCVEEANAFAKREEKDSEDLTTLRAELAEAQRERQKYEDNWNLTTGMLEQAREHTTEARQALALAVADVGRLRAFNVKLVQMIEDSPDGDSDWEADRTAILIEAKDQGHQPEGDSPPNA